MWNRGGEPLWVDPLNKRDRKKNAHQVVLGPTGSGKSGTLNVMVLFTMAVHRPRLFIADGGRSFELQRDFFASQDLTTHYVKLTPDSDVSLPPFALAARLLDDAQLMSAFKAATGASDDELPKGLGDELDETPSDMGDADEGSRDYLGEMLITAAMMITGGEDEEIKRLTRADRYIIGRAIVQAACAARKSGTPHPLVQDVALALMDIGRDPGLLPQRQARAAEMGEAMMVFTQGLRGRIFNRYGQPWPDVDVTLVELGTLVHNEEYKDALAVAYSALVDHVQATGEARQYEGRDNIFLTDEGHLVTTNPLLGPKLAKGTKMWRKLAIWFWLATQDMKDFPDSMSRVLNMCEWWVLLTMEKAEVAEVARFKQLSSEQRALIMSARKDPPKYTEGVLLSSSLNALFRNVPPPLAIALAMTEGHEKAERRTLMDRHGCSELEAAMMVARRLEEQRT